jgi:hypothetical protein
LKETGITYWSLGVSLLENPGTDKFHPNLLRSDEALWIPAFAGMTA